MKRRRNLNLFLALPAHIMRELGLSHVRGLILYGPPGTGKSLLARTIASIIDSAQVRLELVGLVVVNMIVWLLCWMGLLCWVGL